MWAILAALSTWLVLAPADAQSGPPAAQSPYKNLGTLARVLAHVEASYVEPVNQDAAIYGAIRGMVGALDPHSAFLDPAEYRMLTSDTQGRFAGIGVEIDIFDGWLTVVGVFDGGPAEAAGVRVGDRFMRIEGVRARDMPIEEAVRRMRGEPGTSVRIALRREDEEEAVRLELVRALIDVDAVEARLLHDGVVYLRLRVFQQTTVRELRQLLDEALVQLAGKGGVRGVLLDLRDNPGGLVDQAIGVADEFLESGVVVSTRGRDGRELSVATAKARGTRPNWPVVIVVNGFTASASEIVAAALRDHGRAILVGTRTFGKGSVQNVIELPDGSALKLTTARYYTPKGVSLQATGLQPDVVVGRRSAAERRDDGLRESDLEGHLTADESPTGGPEGPERDAFRSPARTERNGSSSEFADDLQAHVAHQTLRALIADRARRPEAK